LARAIVVVTAIALADAAAFVLDQLTDDRYLHKTPLIGY
jgi:hypothetical protein